MDDTQDVQSVLRSQDYFRLKRPIVSPGDIFELDISTKAVYIGPDSDIAEVQLTYFNPDAPNALETATVAINGPFVGRIDALMKTKVPQTQQPGRILVNPVDIVDPNYQIVYPNGGGAPGRQFLIPPQIDLIAALQPLPDIPAVRADKTFRFLSVPYNTPNGGGPMASTALIVPIFGRRMTTVTVVSIYETQVDFGLIYLLPGNSQPAPRDAGSFRMIPFIPPQPQSMTAVIRASDAARAGYQHNETSGLDDISFFDSDRTYSPGFAAGLLTPLPTTKGMADYLSITISDVENPGVDSTRFVDVYVKVSDRET